MVATHYKKDDLLNCWAISSDISGYHADFHEGHGTIGAWQGRGTAWQGHGTGTAWEQHGHGMGTACYVSIGLKSHYSEIHGNSNLVRFKY